MDAAAADPDTFEMLENMQADVHTEMDRADAAEAALRQLQLKHGEADDGSFKQFMAEAVVRIVEGDFNIVYQPFVPTEPMSLRFEGKIEITYHGRTITTPLSDNWDPTVTAALAERTMLNEIMLMNVRDYYMWKEEDPDLEEGVWFKLKDIFQRYRVLMGNQAWGEYIAVAENFDTYWDHDDDGLNDDGVAALGLKHANQLISDIQNSASTKLQAVMRGTLARMR